MAPDEKSSRFIHQERVFIEMKCGHILHNYQSDRTICLLHLVF
jgi:hypothetical protein